MLNSQKDLKAAAKGLHRELKALGAAAGDLSYNQTLEVLAKALGAASYAALMAKLPAATPPALEEKPKPAYPLINRGQFDFPDGNEVRNGLFGAVRGTIDDIPQCIAKATLAMRCADGSLEPEYEGSTEVNWDAQKTCRDQRGFPLWEDEGYSEVSEAQLILVPEGFDPDDNELPVREPLVTAMRAYLEEHPQAVRVVCDELATRSSAWDGAAIAKIEEEVGFALTLVERKALLTELTKG